MTTTTPSTPGPAGALVLALLVPAIRGIAWLAGVLDRVHTRLTPAGPGRARDGRAGHGGPAGR